jgi:hypothetical protein
MNTNAHPGRGLDLHPRAARRLSRRMRFRSRSVAVSIALGLVALATAYLGTEAILAALSLPPLLLAPADLLAAVVTGTPGNIAAATAVGILGVVCLVLALAPGARARRDLNDDRAIFVIDDDVMASGISRAAALSVGVPREQVTTTVSRRRAVVRVRPSTGFPVDAQTATDAASRAVASVAPRRGLTVRTALESRGVLA